MSFLHSLLSVCRRLLLSNTSFVLSEEQQMLYDILEQIEQHTFITGKAGTGKSALLNYFAAHTAKRIVKVAPTGIAALNINGQTIHSFFKFPTGFIDPRAVSIDASVRTVVREIDVLIIDEISMVRVDVIQAIDYVLRKARANKSPFGGVRIIAFGDVYQLPPVVEDSVIRGYLLDLYTTPYFFSAPAWKKADPITYELQSVFRQVDDTFRRVLSSIREGNCSAGVLGILNSRFRKDDELPADAVTLVGTNAAAKAINTARLAALPGKQKIYLAAITGDMPESALPTDRALILKKGALITFVRNDPLRRWVNGSTGIVSRLGTESIEVACGKKHYEVLPVIWERKTYLYKKASGAIRQEVVGTFSQFPIKLAWAITIHKSQGSTYDRVVVDLRGGAFVHGQTYVALSRCRSIEGLYLRGALSSGDMIVDPAVVAFMRHAHTVQPSSRAV